MRLHVEEATFKLRADIYRDKDHGQYSHFMLGMLNFMEEQRQEEEEQRKMKEREGRDARR